MALILKPIDVVENITKEEFEEKTKKAFCANKEVIIDGVIYKLVPKETS